MPPIVEINCEPGIGRVEEAVGRHGLLQVGVLEARLAGRREVLLVDLDQRAHARAREHEAAVQRHRAAREVRARGARRDGEAVLLGEAHDGLDVVARARQGDGVGPRPLQRRGVRRVGDEVVHRCQHVVRPESVAQGVDGERHGA